MPFRHPARDSLLMAQKLSQVLRVVSVPDDLVIYYQTYEALNIPQQESIQNVPSLRKVLDKYDRLKVTNGLSLPILDSLDRDLEYGNKKLQKYPPYLMGQQYVHFQMQQAFELSSHELIVPFC